MSEIELGNPGNLNWTWLVVATALIAIASVIWMRRCALRFASQQMLANILPPKQNWRTLCTLTAGLLTMLLLVLCLADLRWGEVEREVPQKGIEVMFVLDVSRSMLAEDVSPNRLERAKQMIKDTVDEMSGDRIGLAIFAGEVRQRIPMTSHYDDFKQTLDGVSPDDLSRGGSRLGDAIRVGSDGFLSKTNDHQAMVILTDGEDQESEPLKAAKALHEESGLRIFTIGLGDLNQGARVPLDRQGQRDYLQHQGQQVWSKLDGKVLTEIAKATSGAYIPAGTKQVDMADVYHGYIANIDQTEFETAKISQLEARYQWFLFPALILLLVEILLSARIAVSRLGRSNQTAPIAADTSATARMHETNNITRQQSHASTASVE